jgi:hypothetical protein
MKEVVAALNREDATSDDVHSLGGSATRSGEIGCSSDANSMDAGQGASESAQYGCRGRNIIDAAQNASPPASPERARRTKGRRKRSTTSGPKQFFHEVDLAKARRMPYTEELHDISHDTALRSQQLASNTQSSHDGNVSIGISPRSADRHISIGIDSSADRADARIGGFSAAGPGAEEAFDGVMLAV